MRVVPYDPRWPRLYEAELDRLIAAVAPGTVAFEHIGSTAVRGLSAKPICDIVAGYDDPADLPGIITALVNAGYVHRGERGIPGREFFRFGGARMFHIHLVHRGGTFWKEHLAFRDLLRNDPATRDAYGQLKSDLARRYPSDREAYIEAKGPFIRRALGLPVLTQRLPSGLIGVTLFLAFGAVMAGLAAYTLAFPGRMDWVWGLSTDKYSDLRRLGWPAVPILALVSLACALAATGLGARREWGRRTAIGVLVVNMLGDLANGVLHDPRTLIGIPVAGVLIWYLSMPRVREVFGGPGT